MRTNISWAVRNSSVKQNVSSENEREIKFDE